MCLPKAKIEALLNDYLPMRYAVDAKKRLANKGYEISLDVIRNIRLGKASTYTSVVLEIFIEMATEEKERHANIIKTIK